MGSYMQSGEYLEYLIKNCGVRGYDFEEKSVQCARPDVDIILKYVDELHIQPGQSVLEVGCGIGRILRELADRYQIRPYGCEPFDAAVEQALLRVKDYVSDIQVCSVETLAFAEHSMDHVICWGVFDLTNQTLALQQMGRVLKPGGKLLLTGKSCCYYPDDEEAKAAEAASVRKGIPNHYSDPQALFTLADALGLSAQKSWYFPRRGDFVNNQFVPELPEAFYEYCIVFVKDHGVQPELPAVEVGLKQSRTMKQLSQVAQ